MKKKFCFSHIREIVVASIMVLLTGCSSIGHLNRVTIKNHTDYTLKIDSCVVSIATNSSAIPPKASRFEIAKGQSLLLYNCGDSSHTFGVFIIKAFQQSDKRNPKDVEIGSSVLRMVYVGTNEPSQVISIRLGDFR